MSDASHEHHEVNPLRDFFETVEGGPLQEHPHLQILPLLLFEEASNMPPPFVSLAQALADETFSVDEVSEGGSVPNIRAKNSGSADVLVLFGEELVGAKQNRVANASFLVPGQSEVVLDVSCVESGRWNRRRGERFHASSDVISSALKSKMAHAVKSSREQSGRFQADQGEVWEEVSHRMQHSAVRSATGAYDDYRENWRQELDEAGKSFGAFHRQVGFVALRPASESGPARVLGVEAVGRPDVFAKLFTGLLRSYLVDAVDPAQRKASGRQGAAASEFTEAVPFLRALCEADFRMGHSLGAGQDLRLDGTVVSGCALLHRGMVHLTAFPFDRPNRRTPGGGGGGRRRPQRGPDDRPLFDAGDSPPVIFCR